MAYFLVYVYYILIVYSSHRTAWATRFLPTIVWDHLNPLLYCKCNWLVIPDVDEYDKQQFTCPTETIYANLVDGYLRKDNERNENMFRRRWPGTKNDLINSIRNGTIDSFCDPTSADTSVEHRCKDGRSDAESPKVTYKYNKQASKMYRPDNIYVFFNNGNDGLAATLQNKAAKCTMFFAVYVTSSKKKIYGMDFGKRALTGTQNCELSTCPASSVATPTLFASPTTATMDSSPVSSRLDLHTSTQQLASTPTPTSTPKQHGPRHNTLLTATTSRIPKKTVTRNPEEKSGETCKDIWLNYTVFVVFIIVAFVCGIVCTIFAVAVWKAFNKRDQYGHNGEAISSPNCGSPLTEIRHHDETDEKRKENILSRKL